MPAELTPMMRQYMEVKEKYSFTVLATFTKCFLRTLFWPPVSLK